LIVGTNLAKNNTEILWKKRSTLFWDITPCSPLKINHGIISQKMILFITTAVRTSNPTMDNHYKSGLQIIL
jgi:hypothetical protein